VRSKRYRAAGQGVDKDKLYELDEGLQILKATKGVKFDETVEIVVCLGIDAKKTDQMVRGAVALPKGIGKEKKVVVFAEGDKAEAARKAGAIEVGGADLAEKIMKGWMDFDVAIAAPDAMKFVGKLGKVLGPKGKMPSPKAGTVTDNVALAVKEFRAGKIEFRNDDGGNLHALVGKKSFSTGDLKENVLAFLDFLKGARPAGAKGTFVRKVFLSTAMGPSVRIAVAT
jgi:large subunit ribosomal protein L1